MQDNQPDKIMNRPTSTLHANRRPGRRLALITALVAIASATSINADVVPPDQSYAGKTYPEWMAAQWVNSWAIPLDGHHPQQDRTGADTLRNQSGPVWYLLGSGTPVTRRIRIPHGQALLVTFDGLG